MDLSRADYMIGVDMARKGFTSEQIGQAIEQASPELPTRKAGHEADYVARTVKAIMQHPEVVRHAREAQPAIKHRALRRLFYSLIYSFFVIGAVRRPAFGARHE